MTKGKKKKTFLPSQIFKFTHLKFRVVIHNNCNHANIGDKTAKRRKNIIYNQEKIITVPSLTDKTLLSYFQQPIPITKIPTIM